MFPHDLIVHFSYHKCLTSYYQKIMSSLSSRFGFSYEHLFSRHDRFEDAAFGLNGKRVLSVNGTSKIIWSGLPEYRGSHFVRDPRDLVVSGYYYHLWAPEPWCNTADYDKWPRIVNHPFFSRYIEGDSGKHPGNISYKEYLNSLDKERGLILEIIWRHYHFANMRKWDYGNPRILELKYEDIIGNEVECFRGVFEFYGFHPKLVESGLEIVDAYRLKNRVKSDTGHVRKGTARQWENEFSPLVSKLFKEAYGDLLIKLGYQHAAGPA